MTLDLTATLQLAQIASIFVGVIVALVTLRNTVNGLKDSFKVSNDATEKQFGNIQAELKKLGDILVSQARFDEKLTSLDKRVTSHGMKLDELARGSGWVQHHKRESVDGEYTG